MASELDIHIASTDEQLAAHRNVFDIWSKGLSLEDHLRYRMTAPMHQRATWIVGCVDGRVVTSLASYPVRFRVHGEEMPGIAIGSVYTLADFRGLGFAPRLLEWAESHQREHGAAWSVLYCDIKPDYYARLGYALCPSLEGWRDPRDGARRPRQRAGWSAFRLSHTCRPLRNSMPNTTGPRRCRLRATRTIGARF